MFSPTTVTLTVLLYMAILFSIAQLVEKRIERSGQAMRWIAQTWLESPSA